MKKQHIMNLFFILCLLGLAYLMGLFDNLLYGYNNNYPISSRYTNNAGYTTGYMFNDPENKYRSTDGIESNEQYSNPNNIGVDGDLFAMGRYRNYQNPNMIGLMNIM
uniref:Uncharacterized protein n=1 Tax=viral metagenome TaxID=1070528 RepID=A0A6C0CYB3_9ZZZZ